MGATGQPGKKGDPGAEGKQGIPGKVYYINGTEWKRDPNAVAVTSTKDDDNDILWIILLIWVIVLTVILIILIIVLCCIRRKYYMVRKGAFSSANSDFSATWGSGGSTEKKKNGDLDINVHSSPPVSPTTPTAPKGGRPVSNISDIQTGWMGTLKGDHETEYETGTIKDEKKNDPNPPPAAAFMNVDESFIDPTDSLKRAAKAKQDREKEEADNRV